MYSYINFDIPYVYYITEHKKIDKEISLMCEKLGKNILNLDYFWLLRIFSLMIA